MRARDETALRIAGWAVSAAVAALCLGRDLRIVRIGDVLAAAAILTGFLFGTLIFVFQLRLRITDDPHVPNFGRLRKLVDQSYSRLTAAVVASLITTAVAVLADVTAHSPGGADPSISRWSTAAVALFGIRLVTVMPLLIWDLTKAYREVPG